ncbi:AAA family ATPase [Streptomyces sp. NBS 14/10]|uniref:helix-turn-helix transcriptional regulator n=1 Tax=Streptomyces sp. NBS 14/10 TaxID=1945643 RepID=UPI000B7DB2DF|nr:AAA family ATPase [Streptomyces sp. NBS 14/10]KAK1179179.1 AAA family ATPase [Streptomyces sp. NBS 14/10]
MGPLCGRDGEQAAVRGVVADAVAGRGRALLVRGEAGIGKTALLGEAVSYAAREHPAAVVLHCTGLESEVALGFGGLQQLLSPVLPQAEELPGAQRAALHAALGLAGGTARDLMVCTAALALLERAAERSPLLLAVDDLQWLDPATLTTVLFVARRLGGLRASALLAVRDDMGGGGSVRADDLPGLRLGGLGPQDAAALLAGRGRGMSGPELAALVADTGGNPLALLELTGTATTAVTTDDAPGPTPPGGLGPPPFGSASLGPVPVSPVPLGSLPLGSLPLTARLREAFAVRVRTLPAAERTLLLVAAAEDRGRTDIVLAAAARLGVTAAALTSVERAGLVQVSGPDIRFRHPLVRSAVHTDAPFLERRATHLALAAELAASGLATAAAWHRALAATGPDEDIAAALERGADEIADRGGLSAVASVLSRAADLSTTGGARARRLAAAAHAAWKSGHQDTARRLAARATATRPGRPVADRAHDGPGPASVPPEAHASNRGAQIALARLRGLMEHSGGHQDAALRELTHSADALAPHSPEAAAALLFMACDAADHADRHDRMREAALRIADLDLDSRYRRYGRLLAAAFDGDTTSSGADPWRILREAPEELGTSGVHRWLWPLVITRDGPAPRRARDFALAACETIRSSGTLALLALPMIWLAGLECELGLVRPAEEHAEEALRLTRDMDQQVRAADALAVLARLAALRGDDAACRAYAGEALAIALPLGNRSAAAEATWAAGLLALARGDHGEARERLTAVHTPGSPYAHGRIARRSAADLVEAQRAAGDWAAARAVAEGFAGWAVGSGLPWARAQWHRCRALLADAADAAGAEDAFREAHGTDTGTGTGPGADGLHDHPFTRARSALLHGEWLRRARRPGEARAHLRLAADLFEGLGAPVWRDRALGELRAAGGSARRGGEDAASRLTGQELQVARLAAGGLTNREIGARLGVSPRTVGYHLYKIFPKLGITARGELRTLTLDGSASALPP